MHSFPFITGLFFLVIGLVTPRNCVAQLIMQGSRRKGVRYLLRFRDTSNSSNQSDSLRLFAEEESAFPLVITCTDGTQGTVQELDLSNVDSSLLFHNACCQFPLRRDYFHIFQTVFWRNRRKLKPVSFE